VGLKPIQKRTWNNFTNTKIQNMVECYFANPVVPKNKGSIKTPYFQEAMKYMRVEKKKLKNALTVNGFYPYPTFIGAKGH